MSGAKPWRVYDRGGYLGSAWTREEAETIPPTKFGWACAVDQTTAARFVRRFYDGRWQWQADGFDPAVRKRLAQPPAESIAPAPASNLPYRDD